MAPQWMPQNIQKRLLKYVLQQLSLFSEIDLPNLDVSLGTNSRINLRNLELDIEKINIPGAYVRSGTIRDMTLTLTMSGGVSIECTGLEITISPSSPSSNKKTGDSFSLAKSTADLANSVMFDDNVVDEDETSSPKLDDSEPEENQSTGSETGSNQYKLSSMMAKAADMALSKLQVDVTDTKIILLSGPSVMEVRVQNIRFSSHDGVRDILVKDIFVNSMKPDIFPGEGLSPEEQEESAGLDPDEDINSDTEQEDSSDSDSDDYDDRMMSTSFMAENKEDVHKSLMDSMMFANDDASSLYMSATSNLLKSNIESTPGPPRKKVTRIAHIDFLKTSFEGLQNIEDINIELGTVKVAATPIPSCLASLIESVSHLTRFSIPKSRNDSGVQPSSTQTGEPTTPTLISQLVIDEIVISLTSALNSSGEFAQPDSIRLVASKINFEQRSTTFYLGSVSKFTIVRDDAKDKLFQFGDGRSSSSDVRFEILRSDVFRTTILCSKPATVNIDAEVLIASQKFYSLLTPLMEFIKTTSSSKSHSVNFHNASPMRHRVPYSTPKHSHIPTNSTNSIKSEISAQSSSIYVNLSLSEDKAIKVTILPLSYNSLNGVFETEKILFEYINQSNENSYLASQFLVINALQMVTSESEPFKMKSFDGNTYQEISLNTFTKTEIESISFKSDFRTFNEMLSSIDAFTSSVKQAVDVNNPRPNRVRQRKVRMGNSLFLDNSRVLTLAVAIKSVSLSLTHINEQFGNIDWLLDDIGVNIFKDGTIHSFVMASSISRICGLIEEPVLHSANSDDKNLPMLFWKYKNSLSFHLRNASVDYYGHWFTLFEVAQSNAEEQPVSKDFSDKPSSSSTKSKTQIHFTFTDVSIGLNPVNLSSKAELILKKGNANLIIEPDGTANFQSSFSSLSLLLIDDVSNILSDQESKNFRHWLSLSKKNHPSWTLVSIFKSKGYVTVGSSSTLFLNVKINDRSTLLRNQKTGGSIDYRSLVDLRVTLDTLLIDICADSSHCLMQLFKDLKQPVQFSFEEKYKPDTVEIDLFEGIEENFYVSKNKGESSVSDQGDEFVQERASPSESPLEIVEDFYDRSPLIETEASSGSQSFSGNGGSGAKAVIAEENIQFEDDHFQTNNSGQNSFMAGQIIPMSVAVSVSTVTIKLYDGFDWKETQNSIQNAIKRVEDRARIQILESTPGNKNSTNGGSSDLSPEQQSIADESSLSSTEDASTEGPSILFNPDSGNSSEPKEIIGETLYESIHLGFVAGQDPRSFYDSINKSINNQTGFYDYSESPSARNTPSPPSPSSIKSTTGSNRPNTSSHNIDLGKSKGRRLRLKRSKFHKVLIELQELDLSVLLLVNSEPHPKDKPVVFNENEDLDDSELVNRIEVRVRDFQVLDNIPTSSWNMFVGYLREAGDREEGVSMLKLVIDTVRPVRSLAASEMVVSVFVLPLRLYVDQDTLDFITRFSEFKDDRFLTPVLDDDDVFIEKLKVNAVKIKLDYKPKKVDYAGIRSGHTTEFMNFFILDESEMVLKKVVLYGVPGFARVHKLLNDAWMPDIKQNQLGGVLAGLAPVKSIVKIGSGFKDLLVVPVKEYQKDGRVIRSLQKGALSFAKTTGEELLKFGVKLAAGTQTILESTEEALGGDGSAARLPDYQVKKIQKKARRRISSGGSDLIYTFAADKPLIGKSSLNNLAYRRGSFDSFGEDDDDFIEEEDDTAQASSLNQKQHHVHKAQFVVPSSFRGANGLNDEFESDSDIDDEYYEDSEFDDEDQKIVSLYSNQPEDINDGLKTAYIALNRNLGTARNAIVTASSKASESGSAQMAAKEIAKATPIMVIRPIIGTTEAISRALLGGINKLDPEEKRRSEEKYKVTKK